VKKMSISENYEGGVTLIHSDISKFSRGTVSECHTRASNRGSSAEVAKKK
jgi:hypothetical protein